MARISSLNRRGFLKSATASAVGAGVVTSLGAQLARGAVAGGSDVIRLGMIGVGGRGSQLMQGFLERDDCRVIAVCDPHRERLTSAAAVVEQHQGSRPPTTTDLHELLANKEIDAVVVATPDHWHCPAAVYACRAGKHVYVEKPLSRCVWEGRQTISAARKYDRVVQVGTQNRSAPYNFKARDYIQDGHLGKVVLCRVYNQRVLDAYDLPADSAAPEFLDWDKWNGPSTHTSFNSRRYGSWHDFWPTGGGEVTNCGVHQLDLATMVLGIEKLPNSVYTLGQRNEASAAETPDTVLTTFEYDDFPMTFHQTMQTSYMLKTDPGIRNGDMFPYWPQSATRIEIFGTKGVMFLGRHGGGWQVYDRPSNRQPVVKAQEYGRFPDPEHKENFVQSVRAGRRPNADVEYGHRSAMLCHLTNISFRVGNKHLTIDDEAERFSNNEEANALLRYEYRQGYTIPKVV